MEKERDQALEVRGFVLCSNHSPGPDLRANLINLPSLPQTWLRIQSHLKRGRGVQVTSSEPLTRFSLPLPAARPEKTLFPATANSRMSFAPRSPQGGGGGTCQAGWRRAVHSAQGSLPEAASGAASRTDSPSGPGLEVRRETYSRPPPPAPPKVTSSRHSLGEGGPLPLTSACFTWPEPTSREQAPSPHLHSHPGPCRERREL